MNASITRADNGWILKVQESWRWREILCLTWDDVLLELEKYAFFRPNRSEVRP